MADFSNLRSKLELQNLTKSSLDLYGTSFNLQGKLELLTLNQTLYQEALCNYNLKRLQDRINIRFDLVTNVNKNLKTD